MAKLSAKDEEFLLMADNRLDRRLIEGILTDRDATIQEIRENTTSPKRVYYAEPRNSG